MEPQAQDSALFSHFLQLHTNQLKGLEVPEASCWLPLHKVCGVCGSRVRVRASMHACKHEQPAKGALLRQHSLLALPCIPCMHSIPWSMYTLTTWP